MELSRGELAIVDADVSATVNAFLWSTLGRPGRTPYAMRRQHGRTIYLHRSVMNEPAGMDVDHVDGNTLDCRRANLRVCTHAQNQRNYRKTNAVTSSRYKGVSGTAGKWRAAIKIDRTQLWLGVFPTEDAAARAYDVAALALFEDFARLNFAKEAA